MSYETLAELDTRTRAVLSERGRQFFTAEDVKGWLNEGQDFLLAEELYAAKGSWKRTAVPNATTYLLPEDMIAPERMFSRSTVLPGGQPYRLDFENADEFDGRPYAASTTTSRASWVTYGRVAEGLYARVYPALNDYFPIVWSGAKKMKRMVNDTDRTECPAGMSHILVHYAVWQAKKKDEEVRQAQDWRDQVFRDVMEVRARRMRETASDQNARVRIRRRVGRSLR